LPNEEAVSASVRKEGFKTATDPEERDKKLSLKA